MQGHTRQPRRRASHLTRTEWQAETRKAAPFASGCFGPQLLAFCISQATVRCLSHHRFGERLPSPLPFIPSVLGRTPFLSSPIPSPFPWPRAAPQRRLEIDWGQRLLRQPPRRLLLQPEPGTMRWVCWGEKKDSSKGGLVERVNGGWRGEAGEAGVSLRLLAQRGGQNSCEKGAADFPTPARMAAAKELPARSAPER